MRKILISILLVLLGILAYFIITQGVSIGTIQVLSASEIIQLNNDLTDTINETNKKIKSDLQSKKSELNQSIDVLLANKESYYKLANVSTEKEINKANTEEMYNIEYLWVKIGRHARKEGVNIKLDIVEGSAGDEITKNLNFTVIGKYVGIIEFISAIEEDSELNFRINDFILVPNGENLQATFNVKDVKIKLENTTEEVKQTSEANTEEVKQTSEANTENVTENVTENTEK